MRLSSVALWIGLAACFAAGPVAAQDAVTTDDIVHSLKPHPRTRGAPAMRPEDAAFIESVKHRARGLDVEERAQLATVAAYANLPAIDLEVTFALDSAEIVGSAVATVDKLGAALQSPQLADSAYLIAGHTDARGAREYNQTLSERRAEAVKAYLTRKFAIAPERLLAVGYGQEKLKNTSDPLADENRRVEVVNLGK